MDETSKEKTSRERPRLQEVPPPMRESYKKLTDELRTEFDNLLDAWAQEKSTGFEDSREERAVEDKYSRLLRIVLHRADLPVVAFPEVEPPVNTEAINDPKNMAKTDEQFKDLLAKQKLEEMRKEPYLGTQGEVAAKIAQKLEDSPVGKTVQLEESVQKNASHLHDAVRAATYAAEHFMEKARRHDDEMMQLFRQCHPELAGYNLTYNPADGTLKVNYKV